MSLEIWSGGQTGVDRAALDTAMELGIPATGWVPMGRLAEDGPVPARYAGLREAPSADYSVRTLLNVRDTDATLILNWGPPGGGTLETIEFAAGVGRPLLEIDLRDGDGEETVAGIVDWLERVRPVRLNVAGPRASKAPNAYDRARSLLRQVLRRTAGIPGDSGIG